MPSISKTIRFDLIKILQELILGGRYTPGQRIREEEIIEEYGVSRTPIREAFVSLEQEGLIEIKPHKGVFISTFSPEEIIDILRIEGVMEGLAASMAAKNLSEKEIEEMAADTQKVQDRLSKRFNPEEFHQYDRRFHHALVSGSGSPILTKMLEKQLAQIYLCRYYTITAPERFSHSINEHNQIVETLRDRNPKLADQAARNHMESVSKDFRKMNKIEE
jgi:DNA-binding GntR family transcriptional regulator